MAVELFLADSDAQIEACFDAFKHLRPHLEREAFLSLCGEEKTQERMWHLLRTGKPLNN